jgi:hypothetical protein
MCDVFQADAQMGQGPRFYQCLVHVGLEGQPLNVDVMTKRYEAFPPFVGPVVGFLHGSEHPEYLFVLSHEQLSCQF